MDNKEKEQLINLINKVSRLRKKAFYVETEFLNKFEEIYGYEFDIYKHDFIVNILYGDTIIKDIKNFEEKLQFSNELNKNV